MHDIDTYEDLEQWYQRQAGMCQRFAKAQPTVSNWKRRGVPKGYHLQIYLELRQAGLSVNPDLFEIDGELAEFMNSEICKPETAALNN